MNELPREILRRIVAKHGDAAYTDPQKFENLLNDLCGRYQREINVLVTALKERVPLDLLSGSRTTPPELLIRKLETRLEEQTGLTREASRWAVESWALALSVIGESEVRSSAAPQQQPPDSTRRSVPGSATRPPAELSQPAPPAIPQATPPTGRAPSPRPVQPQQGPAGGRLNLPNALPTSVPGGGWRRLGVFRGCLIAFFLLAITAATVLVGVPYAISVMRETQREKNAEPPRFPVR